MIRPEPSRQGMPRLNRCSIRLKGYDYSQPGAYFVTICTQGRACLFGEVVNGEMRLNELGEIVRGEWFKTAQIRPYVQLWDEEFVVMPNHIHGIIWIVDHNVGATRRVAPTRAVPTRVAPTRAVPTRFVPTRVAPTRAVPTRFVPTRVAPTRAVPTEPRGPEPQSVGAIIAQFKSIVTKRINHHRATPGLPVWQRNYYEHIIRNAKSLNRIRQYIANNPLHWASDRENPDVAWAHGRAPPSKVEPWRI